MKYKMRFIALLSAFVLLGSGLSGCASSAVSAFDPAAEGLADNMTLTDSPAEEISLPIAQNTLTLSFFAMSEPYITSKMRGHKDMVVYQEAEKRTGIKINWQEESYTNPGQKMNLMFSSGTMTDIIWDVQEYALGGPKKLLDDGLIVALNPYIEKYAPNLKKLLRENPSLLDAISTDDGRIFMFPTVRLDPIIRCNSGFAIRKDWLERANLPVPQTIEQWYTMLKTFQQMDMNGNGKPDECFVSLGFDKPSQGLNNFAVAYGIIADTDFYLEDGVVKFGPYEPAFKDYVTEMAKWYAEGLLDPNFAIQDSSQFSSKMTDDLGGAYYGSLSGNMGNFLSVRSDDPEYDLIAAPFPQAPDGIVYAAVRQGYGQIAPHGASISFTNDHIVETVKWLDWHYSEEGSTLFNWGIEGQSYEVIEGEKYFTDLINHNPDGLTRYEACARYAGGVITQMPIVEDPEVFMQMKSLPQQQDAVALWSQADTSLLLPHLYFDTPTATENTNIMREVSAYVTQQFNRYVMGVESLDTFDQFYRQLKEMGIETVLENYQEAYDLMYQK